MRKLIAVAAALLLAAVIRQNRCLRFPLKVSIPG